jgi:hypothetical protein
LRWLGHYKNRFEPALEKALKSGTIMVLDRRTFEGMRCSDNQRFEDFTSLAKSYDGPVGTGEAYTHAAAIVLRVASLSNDKSALDVLLKSARNVPDTVLRTMDLIAFAYYADILPVKDCEAFRDCMFADTREKPAMPKIFQNTSFAKGVTNFAHRLCDSQSPRPSTSFDAPPYSHLVVLQRV